MMVPIGAEASVHQADEEAFLACVLKHCSSEQARAQGWCIPEHSPEGEWIVVRHSRVSLREQGWKLHISAGLPFAELVLERVLPVLLANDATFKVAASRERLAAMNRGAYRLSQIGKFITIYPHDDEQAVRLAVILDTVTRGLRGPAILSDRPLAPGSLVYYRYGSFRDHILQTISGSVLTALTTPDGEFVPDERGIMYQPPTWAIDPFLAAGVATPLPPPTILFGNRYLMLRVLSLTARGGVARAVDILTRQQCMLKWARRDAVMQQDGRDARDRLYEEVAVLRALSPDLRFPRVLDLVEQDDELCLIMEEVHGQTLASYVADLAQQGRSVSEALIVAWGRQLAALLAAFHEKGFIHRDVKPHNIMVTSDRELRLIDFDIAWSMRNHAEAGGAGTPGYMSPQQISGLAPTVSDDMYGLGAVLYFLATNADPALTPWERIPHDRPIKLLNPMISERLQQIIHRCLEMEPHDRFASLQDLDMALADMTVTARSPSSAMRILSDVPPVGRDEELETHFAYLARRLGDSLCQTARASPDGPGVLWKTMQGARDMRHPNVYQGSAGVALVLAELADVFPEPFYYERLHDAVHWLLRRPEPPGQPPPGLYTGEAGIGAVLLRAGQILNDQALVAEAVERGRRIAALPYISPDLMSGAAGRLRYHLLLWDHTGDAEQLRHAADAGAWLVSTLQETDRGLCWPVPVDQHGSHYEIGIVGYAHGAAGIADSLLDLFEVTEDKHVYTVAQKIAQWIAQLAVPALDDQSGLAWPKVAGQGPAKSNWANGAAGIGRFLLHAARCALLPEASDLAERAARTAAQGVRWQGPTQAYGLTGNIEFLLDMFQCTGNPCHLSDARTLARILEAFRVAQDGLLLWRGHSVQPLPPGYMCGYAGVAACFLRLSTPSLPHLLSRQGFQQRRRRKGLYHANTHARRYAFSRETSG